MIGNLMKFNNVCEVNDEAEDWRIEAGQVGHPGAAQGALADDELDPQEVKRAREEEMDFVKKMPVYEERDVEECWRVTGRPPISTRWVDVQMAGGVRSRWVARDFKPAGAEMREDLFAAMPPLEAKRMLFRRFALRSNLNGKREMELMLTDVT